jgi:hypothetical protein
MHSPARAAVVMLVSLSAVRLLGQQTVSFQPGPLTRIAGSVIDADSGQPVAGARVLLSAYGPPKRQVTTDDHGRFVIEAAPAGSFELVADLEGYWGAEFGQRFPRGSWQRFDVTDGEQVSDVVLEMWRLASISGVVLNEDDEPARGVSVQALSLTEVDGHIKSAVVGRPSVTDAKGEYSVTRLVPGSFIVAAGGGSTGSSTRYFPSSLTPDGAMVLRLAGGEDRRDVAVRLPPESGHIVSGRLTGVPLPARTVPLHLRPVSGDGRIAPLATLSILAESDGSFVFRNVPAGRYAVTAVAVPHAAHAAGMLSLTQELMAYGQSFALSSNQRGGEIAPAPITPTLWASAPVVVGDTDVTTVEAAIQQGATIRGHVRFDPAGDQPTIEQIRRTPIIVIESSRPDLGWFPSGAIDADGGFRMVGLPPGHYAIRILPLFETGLRGWSTMSARLSGREVSGTAFELGTADILDLVITLTTRPATVTGVVRDDTGRTVTDAMLYVFPADRSRWGALDLNEHWPSVIRPARSGRYQTYGLAPGDYVIAALTTDAPDPPRTTADLDKIFDAGVPVTVSPNETRALDLVLRRWPQ